MSLLTGYSDLRDRAERTCAAGKLRVDHRYRQAVGGLFRRARQGPDPSALRELPSRQRPSAPGRRTTPARAAGLARAPTGTGSRRCAVRSVIRRRISSPPESRGTRNGISHRAKWRGKARRSRKYARRSKIRSATAIARSKSSIHHIGEDTLVGWAWAPGYGRQPAPGTQKQAGALVEAWVKTGAACPAD